MSLPPRLGASRSAGRLGGRLGGRVRAAGVASEAAATSPAAQAGCRCTEALYESNCAIPGATDKWGALAKSCVKQVDKASAHCVFEDVSLAALSRTLKEVRPRSDRKDG